MNEVEFTSVSKGRSNQPSKYSEFTIDGPDKSSKEDTVKPFVRLRGGDTLEDLYNEATDRSDKFNEPDNDDFDELLGKYDDDDDDEDDDDDIEETKTFFSLRTRGNVKW